jgi:hypothetical protein
MYVVLQRMLMFRQYKVRSLNDIQGQNAALHGIPPTQYHNMLGINNAGIVTSSLQDLR